MEVTHEAVVPPREGEVLIRIDNFNLCGSDLGIYSGKYSGPVHYPIYPGHEWAGTVAEVGPGVEGLKEGDAVTGDCSLWCGSCRYCALDKNLCETVEKVGITRDGAARRYFVQDARYVYRASGIPLDVLSLAEPLAVAVHAASAAEKIVGDLAGQKILILGGGSIGISLVMVLCRVFECAGPDLYDPIPYRMEKAVSVGAKRPEDPDYVAGRGRDRTAGDYRDLYSGKAYDLVFESTGTTGGLSRALDVVRPLGAVGIVGFVPSGDENIRLITLKALTVRGSIGGTGEFPRVLKTMREDPGYFKALVTHRFSYRDFERAFEAAMDKERSLKVQISLGEP